MSDHRNPNLTCRACKFFGHESDDSGSCRASAPTLRDDGATTFPVMPSGGWCGLWELNEWQFRREMEAVSSVKTGQNANVFGGKEA